MKGLGVVGEKSYAFAIRIVNAYKIYAETMNLSFRNNYCGAERPLERYVAKRNMRKVKPIF